MDKTVFDYKAVVWDLDGTLYYQSKMRLIMLKELLKYYLHHPLRIKELFAVKKFREVREHWEELRPDKDENENLEEAQYGYVAGLLGMEPQRVRECVEDWIYEKPLSFIRSCRDEEAADLFDELRKRRISIFIFSDYPITAKLKALGLEADGAYAATDEMLGKLKPDPKGLLMIMEENDLRPGEILMIGDRDSRDGESARRAGTDYYILAKNSDKRRIQYLELRGKAE